MFILIRTTIAIKYIPIIWEKKRTMIFELFELEIQMKNLDIVSSNPKLHHHCSVFIKCISIVYLPTLNSLTKLSHLIQKYKKN